MLISVIILPFLSSFLIGCFGRLFGKTGTIILSNLFIFISFFLSLLSWYEINLSSVKILINIWDWFTLTFLHIEWTFLFDNITTVMLVIITSISSLVHVYSTSYMEEDPHIIRFMSYLSLFTFFMIILVTSGNFIQMFMGWEGVGISSYLLINFWYTRIAANQSAIKAVIVNRFGDVGILMAILTIFILVKSVDFNVVFSEIINLRAEIVSIYNFEIHALTFISIALFLGAVGKSAQLGLHTWLPDAMEGPTPVSALIHAATMVTAGVFVLIRISPILECSAFALSLIICIGALTAFFAGTIGIFQNDLKRVIAYSTCSQLGYMVVGCGLSSYSVALFHLANHAFFKALLFLSAGAVIHAVLDEQDMRKMGGLFTILPYTFNLFIIGSLSLMGFPYTTGYYSKDILLELAISYCYISGLYVYWLLLLGAGCTAFYSFRLLYLTFLSETNLNRQFFKYVHDVPKEMGGVLFILGLSSIFFGYICKDMFLGLGSGFFGNSLGYNIEYTKIYQLLDSEFLATKIKLIPIVFSLCSAIFAYITYRYYYFLFRIKYKNQVILYTFFNKKWYFDKIYNQIFVSVIFNLGYLVMFRLLDRGIIELFGPTGAVRFFVNYKNLFLEHNTGYIFKGIFIIILGLILYINFTINLLNFTSSIYLLFIYCVYLGIYFIKISLNNVLNE